MIRRTVPILILAVLCPAFVQGASRLKKAPAGAAARPASVAPDALSVAAMLNAPTLSPAAAPKPLAAMAIPAKELMSAAPAARASRAAEPAKRSKASTLASLESKTASVKKAMGKGDHSAAAQGLAGLFGENIRFMAGDGGQIERLEKAFGSHSDEVLRFITDDIGLRKRDLRNASLLVPFAHRMQEEDRFNGDSYAVNIYGAKGGFPIAKFAVFVDAGSGRITLGHDISEVAEASIEKVPATALPTLHIHGDPNPDHALLPKILADNAGQLLKFLERTKRFSKQQARKAVLFAHSIPQKAEQALIGAAFHMTLSLPTRSPQFLLYYDKGSKRLSLGETAHGAITKSAAPPAPAPRSHRRIDPTWHTDEDDLR